MTRENLISSANTFASGLRKKSLLRDNLVSLGYLSKTKQKN